MAVIVAVASVLNLQAERWVGLMELPQQHRAHRRDITISQPTMFVSQGRLNSDIEAEFNRAPSSAG